MLKVCVNTDISKLDKLDKLDKIDSKPDASNDNESDHSCSICKDDYDIDSKTTLLCYHSFHYDCILDSYKYAVKTKKSDEMLICPLCRQHGGYLPRKPGVPYVQNVHYPPPKAVKSPYTGYQPVTYSYNIPVSIPTSISSFSLSQVKTPYIPPVKTSNMPKTIPKQICKAIIKSPKSVNYNKQCTHFALSAEGYCGKHSNYKYI
jgi:ubiquitin